jgi:hypothetical protein
VRGGAFFKACFLLQALQYASRYSITTIVWYPDYV